MHHKSRSSNLRRQQSDASSVASSSLTQNRPQTVVTAGEVHLPPSSPPRAFQIYKSGKWKSDEELILPHEPISSSSSPSSDVEIEPKRNSTSSKTTDQEQDIDSSVVDESTTSEISKVSKEGEKYFLGIYVHQTSNLKFDSKIRSPRVVVSLVDAKTGQLSVYSQETLKEKQLEQPFILPEVTGPCSFISNM